MMQYLFIAGAVIQVVCVLYIGVTLWRAGATFKYTDDDKRMMMFIGGWLCRC